MAKHRQELASVLTEAVRILDSNEAASTSTTSVDHCQSNLVLTLQYSVLVSGLITSAPANPFFYYI